jgi:hypothetical protein
VPLSLNAIIMAEWGSWQAALFLCWGVEIVYAFIGCLVFSSGVRFISLRVCCEYIVPPLFNAIIMAAWVSWHAAMFLLMNWLFWGLHSPAMCVQIA